jgi:carboxyl-terminal processing protease
MSTSRCTVLSFIVFFLSHAFSITSYANTSQQSGLVPLEELRYFTQAFERIKKEHIEKINDKELLEMAIEGLLSTLDPHSAYLDKNTFSLLQEKTTGKFEGLGIEISQENGALRVISPIDGSPAYKAGVLPGDLIIKLNDSNVQSMSFNEAIKLMKGPKGSILSLTILRSQVDGTIEINIERDIIEIDSVRTKILESDIAYIRIAQFQENTGMQFKKLLSNLYVNDISPKGLIIDLRNNPGGLLTSSIEVVDSILDKGLIVYTEGRSATSNKKYYASVGDDLNGLPIVVLINEGSASASEIVAGALQDHNRALILGTSSFGKGSVQTIFPLGADRGLKLTTARYFTPNGTSIQGAGISPDIAIEPAEIKIRKSKAKIKEENLLGHLSNPVKVKGAVDEKEVGVIDDNQLYDAINLLKGLHILNKKT